MQTAKLNHVKKTCNLHQITMPFASNHHVI